MSLSLLEYTQYVYITYSMCTLHTASCNEFIILITYTVCVYPHIICSPSSAHNVRVRGTAIHTSFSFQGNMSLFLLSESENPLLWAPNKVEQMGYEAELMRRRDGGLGRERHVPTPARTSSHTTHAGFTGRHCGQRRARASHVLLAPSTGDGDPIKTGLIHR